MEIQNLSFEYFSQFSQRDVEYQLNPEKFAEFISFLPDLGGMKKAVLERNKYPVDRSLLTRIFKEQYNGYSLSEKQTGNIEKLLKDNTFTITTAHQPSLFTGPAYYMYKIISAIRLAQLMEAAMPDNHFVPVFINGSEDHDFDEINHTTVFHKKITWESGQKGPVGRYTIDSLADVIQQFSGILGDGEKAVTFKTLLTEVYRRSRTYNDFTRGLLQGLTSQYGLLVLNMDDPALKRAFIPVMERELIKQESEKLVLETQQKLATAGYKPQAFPRPVNLFYFTKDGGRERVTHENGFYRVIGTDLRWTREEVVEELYKYPENFSPNVILRPLYQSFILPDAAFVGGGGEIAYWMERKEQFKAFNIFFPNLIRRNSVFMIAKNVHKTMVKLDMKFSDFIPEEEKIIHEFLAKADENQNVFETEKKVLDASWDRLADHVAAYDKTLTGFMQAEKSKIVKIIEHAEQKLYRARKQHEEIKVQQIKGVKEKLFPHKNIQEREDNFFQFYLQADEDLMDALIPVLNPLEKDCKILFL